MIDPHNITKFDRTTNELEEFIIFAILVAGKRADYTTRKLQLILERLSADKTDFVFDVKDHSPFILFRDLSYVDTQEVLSDAGIGCYKLKAQAIKIITSININLHKCNIDDLETIKGIGKKTSRYFILHSQKGVRVAPLDTHILKHLGTLGYKVPKSTPQSEKRYKELEETFISLVPVGKSIADYDLEIWKQYAKSKPA